MYKKERCVAPTALMFIPKITLVLSLFFITADKDHDGSYSLSENVGTFESGCLCTIPGTNYFPSGRHKQAKYG